MSRKWTAAVILIVLFLLLGVALYSPARESVDEEPVLANELVLTHDGKLHVLLIGEDYQGQLPPEQRTKNRSDALMVASVDLETSEMRLLSIPRDTLVVIPGREGKDKINHALAFGGVELTMRTVREFLGIPICYYVYVDLNGFRQLVDAMGGIPIRLEKDLKYVDSYGDTCVVMQKGDHVLGGVEAEAFVRFRKGDGDLARTGRQRQFVIAAIKQLLKPGNVMKMNELISMAREMLCSNIPQKAMLEYLPRLLSLEPGSVKEFMVEGKGLIFDGIYYYEPDLVQLNQLVRDYFYPGVDLGACQGLRVLVVVANEDHELGEQIATLLQRHGLQVTDVIQGEEVQP
ncbi:MAG TPA: hypothetical protein DDZ53_08975, partial [Firmicutes bacterium]|nr:hypothetical protein [Bacillota bacterium]